MAEYYDWPQPKSTSRKQLGESIGDLLEGNGVHSVEVFVEGDRFVLRIWDAQPYELEEDS